MTQEALRAPGATGFSTGTICTDSNLYRCSDDTIEVIEYVAAGQAFPNGPFGNGKGKTTWFKITLATDGHREVFDAVKTDNVVV